LTYHAQPVDDEADRPATKPADKIEITPEMIEAGAEVMWDALEGLVTYGSDTGREWAKRVFVAMAARIPSEAK
jgi:hypothetical protein